MSSTPAEPDVTVDTTRNRRVPAWVWLVIALGMILAIAAAYVAVNSLATEPERQPPPTHPTTETEQSEPSTADEPVIARTVLPECDTANVFAMTQAEGDDRGTEEIDSASQSAAFGSAANEALSNSVQSRGCDYPRLTQLSAELSQEVMAELREAVLEQGDTVESTHGIATAYTWTDRPPHDPNYDQTWSYVFVADVWIAMYLPGSEIESAFIDSAIAGVLEANPHFQ